MARRIGIVGGKKLYSSGEEVSKCTIEEAKNFVATSGVEK